MTLSWVISLSRNVLAITFSSLNNAPFLRTRLILRRLYNIRPSHLPRTCFSQSRFCLAGEQTDRLVRFAVFEYWRITEGRTDRERLRLSTVSDLMHEWASNAETAEIYLSRWSQKFRTQTGDMTSKRAGWYTVVKLITHGRRSESPGFLSSFHV